ncbi:sugar phosphate isomerase/epimerase family protein [Paenibacillus abyssi]|uniref:Protein FrlC n=1 Tax=Paenibacillus abyssi TaxID=1340531 RepID=A0A917G0S2_9BACL|nr:sugar phosphate isomerase/epimerase family protein [Paenibacillus abyssi]GGG16752.1 protein FrlC [Paenibacillus abyssi]
MNPKISIGSWAFAFGPFAGNPWSFSKILKYASEARYDGVEINGFLPHPVPETYDTKAKRSELLKEIESYGLGISGYAPDFNNVPPAIVDGKKYLELLKRYIEFCQDLDIKTIRVDTISPPEALSDSEYSERFERLVSTWRSSAELAGQSGMNIVWEFEPGFWLNKPSEVKRLMESVNHPAFQILFDTSHAYMSGVVGARHFGEQERLAGGIIEYANMLKGHIGHFHLIDSDGTLHDDETSTHAEFGSGHIDFTAFLKEMKDVLSPLEWWTVDFCFNAEVEAWGKEAVPFIKERIKEAT